VAVWPPFRAQRYNKKCTYASKKRIFVFFGSNKADNPNIFCNFAPVLQRKVKIP
jgi:hypothetical protein